MSSRKAQPSLAPLRMGCGGCGGKRFSIYLSRKGRLIAKCCKCRGRTTIRVEANIDYSQWTGKGGLGIAPSTLRKGGA